MNTCVAAKLLSLRMFLCLEERTSTLSKAAALGKICVTSPRLKFSQGSSEHVTEQD